MMMRRMSESGNGVERGNMFVIIQSLVVKIDSAVIDINLFKPCRVKIVLINHKFRLNNIVFPLSWNYLNTYTSHTRTSTEQGLPNAFFSIFFFTDVFIHSYLFLLCLMNRPFLLCEYKNNVDDTFAFTIMNYFEYQLNVISTTYDFNVVKQANMTYP